jgi:hypothetical protein
MAPLYASPLARTGVANPHRPAMARLAKPTLTRMAAFGPLPHDRCRRKIPHFQHDWRHRPAAAEWRFL